MNSPQISFEYMFGSDEYYEYIGSAFNDAFAFFLNGENIALLPDGTPVAINSVNPMNNSELYHENDVSEPSGMQYIEIEADGFTSIMTASGATNETGWNTIKLVIADVSDRILDSYVLLSANSFTCVEAPLADPVPTTAAPTVSLQPSLEPTMLPSSSSKPTLHSTDSPSTSREPSVLPSSEPSYTTRPTLQASNEPSMSNMPSSLPSQSPTISSMPTTQPSINPTSSVIPTMQVRYPLVISDQFIYPNFFCLLI